MSRLVLNQTELRAIRRRLLIWLAVFSCAVASVGMALTAFPIPIYGWHQPNHTPDDQQIAALTKMLTANAIRRQDPVSAEYRFTHWWTGYAVPNDKIDRSFFGYYYGNASDFVRVEERSETGSLICTKAIFIKWLPSGEPYCIATLDPNTIPKAIL